MPGAGAVHPIKTFGKFASLYEIKGLPLPEYMIGIRSEHRLIDYARVSTYGQTLDVWLDQLRAAGCSGRNIYREKVTGARADRRELLHMLDRLVPGILR
jgi:hypothetical protein